MKHLCSRTPAMSVLLRGSVSWKDTGAGRGWRAERLGRREGEGGDLPFVSTTLKCSMTSQMFEHFAFKALCEHFAF